MKETLLRTAKLVGPYVLVPIAICLFLDYLQAVATIIKVAAGAWLALLGLSMIAGFAIGMMIKLNPSSAWKDVGSYNLVRVMPSLGWGIQLADWLLQEIKKEEELVEGETPELRESLQ